MSAAVTDAGGEWTCGDTECHHVNFARRTQCNKCQRERSPERSNSAGGGSSSKKKLGTEIGKAAAEKSRGLFSAEDWQCSKCANVNWARRQTCNMCNAPKFSDVEERTGYGGGYNDRGIVEYKERSESDSEYDEFGRRKKRKNKDDHTENNSNKRHHTSDDSIAKNPNDYDDEEDDDDDGDGDYSKYDLWGDDEIAKQPTSIKSNKQKTDESRTKEKIKKEKLSPTRSQSSSSYSTSSSSSSSTSSSSSSSSSSSQNATQKRARSRSRNRTLTKDKVYSRPAGSSSSSYSSHSFRAEVAAKKKPQRRDADNRSPLTSHRRTHSRSSSTGKQRQTQTR